MRWNRTRTLSAITVGAGVEPWPSAASPRPARTTTRPRVLESDASRRLRLLDQRHGLPAEPGSELPDSGRRPDALRRPREPSQVDFATRNGGPGGERLEAGHRQLSARRGLHGNDGDPLPVTGARLPPCTWSSSTAAGRSSTPWTATRRTPSGSGSASDGASGRRTCPGCGARRETIARRAPQTFIHDPERV